MTSSDPMSTKTDNSKGQKAIHRNGKEQDTNQTKHHSHSISPLGKGLPELAAAQHSWPSTVWCSGSHSVAPGPAAPASASPGNLLEMQILKFHPRHPESETLGVEPSELRFNKPASDTQV